MSRWFLILMSVFLLALVGPAFAQGEPGEQPAGTESMVGAPSEVVAAAGSGIAERYWVRFMADSTPTLWLFVGGAWRKMDNPSAAVTESVQEAFCGCTDPLEVYVGYSDSNISWVVVRSTKPPGAVVKVINMIPASLSGESHQDSEPFLAIDRAVPNNMAGTAFTPNPASSGNAPIYVSKDGGATWLLNAIVPSSVQTSDITVAGTSKSKRLHSGILKRPGSLLMNILRTDDFFASTTMSVQVPRSQVDQPFVQAAREGSADRVYVGSNDFGASGGKTATVDVSLDDGATFKTVRIEPRSTLGQNGPSVRPTIAKDGTVYVAYFGWRSVSGNLITSDIVVVRDDKGATGTSPFTDLKDPSDSLPGRKVVTGVTIPWSNAPTLGNERIGSTLSIAVDPNKSDNVYVGWADRVGDGDIYSIHVRRSTDRGITWSGDLRRIKDATPFALAVAENGTVGFLYQQFTGGRWVTHLEQTRDGFATIHDTVLATVPGNTPAPQFLPYIGDYNFLLGVGNAFQGIFSANNTPDKANFPKDVIYQRNVNFTTKTLLDGSGNTVPVSIDPFYFTVPAIK